MDVPHDGTQMVQVEDIILLLLVNTNADDDVVVTRLRATQSRDRNEWFKRLKNI